MADLIRSELLRAHGVTALFTLRSGGISPPPFDSLNFGPDDSAANIAQNLRTLIDSACLPAAPHQAEQIHHTDLLECSGPGRMHDQSADILITTTPGSAVAVRTADCLPILLADPDSGMVAAVHAGWRGTAAGAAARAVAAMMQQCGVQTEQILASLGPCIGPCCFEIGAKTADALQNACPGADRFIEGHPHLHADLQQINRLQLQASGLDPAHIEIIEGCTCCQPDRFFSYRRDGGNTGRHLAVVASPSST